MLRPCCWFRALQMRRAGQLQRTAARVPHSLLDLLTEKPTAKPQKNEATRPATTTTRKDFLKLAIKRAGTREQLLKVIGRHGVVMGDAHLMQCWKRFALMIQQGEDAQVLRERQEFQELAELTCARMNLFDVQQIVTLSKIMSQVPFAADSSLVRELCGELTLKLKDLSLLNLLMLQFFLSKIPGKSTYKEVIMLAIPSVFQSRVQVDLKTDNSTLCYRSLLFVLSEKIDQATCDFVGERALRFCKEFSLVQAFIILECASHKNTSVQFSAPMRQILTTCLDIIAANKSRLEEKDVEMILRCCKTQRVFSKALFEIFWALAPSWPLDLTLSLLKTSFKVNYLSLPAAEVAMNVLLENVDQHPEVIDVTRLAEAVALVALHYDNDSDQAQRALTAGRILVDDLQLKIDETVETKPHLLAQIMLCLGVVGVFPKERLDVLFDIKFQRQLAQHESAYKFLLELEQCITTSLGDTTPYKAIPELKALADRDSSQVFVPRALTETLEIALGGEQFVAKHVTTPLGAKADYMVAMRKGEYAIAVSDSLCYPFEKLPIESKVVAILVEKEDEDTFTHTGLRKLLFALQERHLRAQNICTMVINLAKFESLPMYEKTPFVMKILKDVLHAGPVYNETGSVNFPVKW